VSANNGTNEWTNGDYSNSKTTFITNSNGGISLYFHATTTEVIVNTSVYTKIMLNEGSQAYAYQPYNGEIVHKKELDNVATAAANAAANSKQKQLYRHTVHLGPDSAGPYFSDLIIANYIDENNRNLTNAEIVDIINNHKANIELVASENSINNSIPLNVFGTFRVSTDAITGALFYYDTSEGINDDSCGMDLNNITQTFEEL
jgi:hypothetical protein